MTKSHICDKCKENKADAGTFNPSGYLFSRLHITKRTHLCTECYRRLENMPDAQKSDNSLKSYF